MIGVLCLGMLLCVLAATAKARLTAPARAMAEQALKAARRAMVRYGAGGSILPLAAFPDRERMEGTFNPKIAGGQ